MPEKVEDCVQSVLDDNPEYSESRAYAICNAKQNQGELGLDDPNHDELLRAYAESDLDCPSGKVKAGQTCVEIEEVDAPPSVLDMSEPSVYTLADLSTEPIERLEENGSVRYSSVRLLGPGVWTDSESRETIWYSPKGIENLEVVEDNTLNMMHDENNEVSDIGFIDPESVETDSDGYLYGDLVLHLDNSASEYADENLQATLESQGAKGFGGPSVEIRNQPEDVEFNEKKGMRELVGGELTGAALVSNPASKNVAFATQTAKRGVALSEGEQTTMVLESERSNMSESTIGVENALEALGIETDSLDLEEDKELADVPVAELVSLIAESYDADPADLMEALDPFLNGEGEEEEQDMQEDEEGEEEESEDGEEGDGENENEEEDEGDEIDIEMKVESLEERVSNMESMMESAMAAEDVQEELEEFEQDLADAETVNELEEAKEDLEKRLSDLEDKPDYKTLSDNGEDEEDVEGNVHFAGSHDPVRGTYSR